MWVSEIEEELKEHIIPFWLNLKDEEHGGFYGYLDFDLNLNKTADKGCILNSRILWFFSNAYRMYQEPAYLDAAKHAYDFLIKYAYDAECGGIYWSLTYDGQIADPTKHTYNQAFAIYALASFYDITKDVQALKLAYELVDIIENACSDANGYLEAFTRDFKPGSNEKLSENGVLAERTMNTLLHVMEAYTELYRVDRTSENAQFIEKKLLEILQIFEKKMYNPLKKRQEVFFDLEYHSLIDLHSYGHDIEASWLIDRALEVLDKTEVSEHYAPILEAMVAGVYNQAFDGKALYNECENGINDTKRIWWVQCESIIGFLNAYTKNPNHHEYLEAAEQIWKYTKENIIDKRSGSEWLSEVDEKNVPMTRKPIVEPWKCPYHNGRMCLEVIRRSHRKIK